MFQIFQGLSILASPYLKSFRYLIAYKNLLRAIENIGIAVVYGIRSRFYTWICYCYSLKDFLQVLWYREDNT